MKKSVDSILHCRWLVPVRPARKIYEHCCLVLHRGKIVDIGLTDQISRQYEAHQQVDLRDHLVIPGLINSHTHASMSLFQGIADDLELNNWLQHHIWPLEAKWVNADFVAAGSRLAIAQMLKSGTTCFNDMYFFADQTLEEVKKSGIRASLGLIIIDAETIWASNIEDYLRQAIRIHDCAKDYPLVTTAFAPHAPYSVSDSSLHKVRVRAEELGLPIHIHVHETESEISQSLAQYGVTPIQRLKQLELLSPSLMAVHVTQCNDEDLDTLAEYGVQILHCPESNMKLASGTSPVKKFLDQNINVALGTDGSASNNDLNMLGEMRTAGLLAKTFSKDATALDTFTLLEMATINGAKALGLEHQIGSLEPNKSADLVAINLNDLQTQPVYSPLSQLVYSASRRQVTDVWIEGERVLENGTLTRIDESSLLREVRHWQAKLSG